MAITKLQANIIDGIADTSQQLLAAMNKIATLVQYFNAEAISSLTAEDIATLGELSHVTPEDIATLGELSHVTPAELAAARNAMSELLTAGGGYATGSIMTRLSKITKNIP